MRRLTRVTVAHWLEKLLHTHDTPHRTALAFAVGVFIGFSPLLGVHGVLGVVVAFAFGLNRVAVLLGVYLNLPWFLAPYYTVATIAGAGLLRTSPQPGLLRELAGLLRAWPPDDPGRMVDMLRPVFWSFMVGSTVLAAVLAVIAYRVALTLVLARRRRHSAPKKVY